MTTLRDLFDQGQLGEAIGDGYVRVQHHPNLPLVIYNYTEKAAYERAWTPATTACRGLIADRNTGLVVARCYEKFHNHNEPESADIVASREPVTVTDKADGSLGIGYPAGGGFAVATRGSFASEQAIHATEHLRTLYGSWVPPLGLTPHWEIIYPANRIVVNYGDTDSLFLHGFVDIETGRNYHPDEVDHDWPGPVVQTFPYTSYAEALAAEPRDNREGLVVHFRRSDRKVKIKQADYLALHKVVTGLNARVVWEHLRDGKPLTDLLEPLPDEFRPWVVEVADALTAQVDEMTWEVEDAFLGIAATLPVGFTRKDFALAVKAHRHAAALFRRLDNRDYTPMLWRQIDPGAEWRPTSQPAEEAA